MNESEEFVHGDLSYTIKNTHYNMFLFRLDSIKKH